MNGWMQQRRALVLGASLGWLPAGVWARDAVVPATALVRRVLRAPVNTYFTYPHSNGFLPDGGAVLASPDGKSLEYLRFDLNTGQARRINRIPGANMYYAISATGLIATTYPEGLMVFDGLQTDAPPRTVTRHPGWSHHVDCDIDAAGRRALVTRIHDSVRGPERHRADMVDLATGESRLLMQAEWLIDHAHFSPFDPAWVSMACGEPDR